MGKEFNPDDTALKNIITHKSGSAGGMLVGKRHSEGGIKAINTSTGSQIEMEGGEVVITRPAVADTEKKEFEGQMLTNREILSKINSDAGGVSFADGGQIATSGREYKYGGRVMKDYEIAESFGYKPKMNAGGSIEKLSATAKKIYDKALVKFHQATEEEKAEYLTALRKHIHDFEKEVELLRDKGEEWKEKEMKDFIAAGKKFLDDHGAKKLMLGGEIKISDDEVLVEHIAQGDLVIDKDGVTKTYDWHSKGNKLKVISYDVEEPYGGFTQEYMVFVDGKLIDRTRDYGQALRHTHEFYNKEENAVMEDGGEIVVNAVIEEEAPPTENEEAEYPGYIRKQKEKADEVINCDWSRLAKATFCNDKRSAALLSRSKSDSPELKNMWDAIIYIWGSALDTVKAVLNDEEKREREVMVWWSSLSFNEQKEFAAKHLLSYEANMVIGNLIKYTSTRKWRKLITEIWEKEKTQQ